MWHALSLRKACRNAKHALRRLRACHKGRLSTQQNHLHGAPGFVASPPPLTPLSRVGFLQAQPYKWRRTKRLVTAQRRKFSAQARPDSSRSSPSTYHYLPRKNLPLKGVWGGSRRNAFLVVRLFGRLSHSAKTCPEKAAPSPWGFWRVDGEIGRQVAGGKGVADSGSLAKGGKTVGDLTPRPLPREPGLSVANAWAGGGGTSTSGGGLAGSGSIKLLLPSSPDQPRRARLKWFRGAPTSNDGDVSS